MSTGSEVDTGRVEVEEPSDFAALLARRDRAQVVVDRMLDAARAAQPDHPWTTSDLLDVIAASRRIDPRARVAPGRDFRKRLREQILLADRYGDVFSCVVLTLRSSAEESTRTSVLDALIERLRRTDVVFAYRRRFALLLAHTDAEAVAPLLARVRRLLVEGVGDPAVLEKVVVRTYPSDELPSGRGDELLDWAEDALRDPSAPSP
ncbi:MAG: hypothetical protein IT379_05140 [Deltaproteobacteria bacterium]|nr:hypothetical protein [Deltaproteobacteria bacterium]